MEPLHGLRDPRRFSPDLALLTAFWVYVTLSNVLYGMSMQASLAAIGVTHVFSPWHVRLVQHAILYPALVACMWMSQRIGWRLPPRSLPLQLLIALAFASLSNPAMDLASFLAGLVTPHPADMSVPELPEPAGQQAYLWLAAGTNFFLTYTFCLALLAGFGFYRRLRDAQLRTAALEQSLSAAHLSALRMQLSPHMLFNLLHTIRGNVTWDPAAAQTMIVQLSDLLRRLLRAGESELSRLHDEVAFVRLYLQLQQRRFSDRLTISLPEEQSLPSVLVPSLILQPLVENAVVHGLANHAAPVLVRVEASLSGEALTLRVVNSVGAAEANAGEPGIGIRNVRERLAIQFGERAVFTSAPGPDGNWIAEIRLPFLHEHR